MIVRKGYNPAIDSYSAFFENDHETPPGCMATCKREGSTRLTMVGSPRISA
jgi:nicotinamidase/pyrazinamidase